MLLTFFKIAVGLFATLMALFCTFVIMDVAHDLIMQGIFRKPGPLTHYDKIDYVNVVAISALLAIFGYWLMYLCFF